MKKLNWRFSPGISQPIQQTPIGLIFGQTHYRTASPLWTIQRAPLPFPFPGLPDISTIRAIVIFLKSISANSMLMNLNPPGSMMLRFGWSSRNRVPKQSMSGNYTGTEIKTMSSWMTPHHRTDTKPVPAMTPLRRSRRLISWCHPMMNASGSAASGAPIQSSISVSVISTMKNCPDLAPENYWKTTPSRMTIGAMMHPIIFKLS